MHDDDPELSRTVRLADLDDGPVSISIEATADECAALARRFGILAVLAASARLTVAAEAGGAILDGTIEGRVTQTCAVTLEPVDSTIASGITVRYMSPDVFAALRGDKEEEFLDAEAEDVEPLPDTNGTIDVGEVVAQYMALALDPYPRKPGVDFVGAGDTVEEEARPNPFDVLKKLKDRG